MCVVHRFAVEMLWHILLMIFPFYQTTESYTISKSSDKTQYHSESNSHSKSSSHHSEKGGYSYHTVHGSPSFGYSADLHLPLGYGLPYASDFDFYDPDLDPDFIGITSSYYDPDFDLDLDFTDIDLDLDFLKLKYGLYGLNHITVREPHFNDYKFRRRLRYRSRPYSRLRHRYYPRYWKGNMDFWGLDSYSLGFEYDKYGSDIDLPISYVHFQSFK